MTFSEKFRELRLRLGMSLRAFCAKHGLDPSNISKLERGLVSAPQKQEILQRYAACLEIKEGSDDWYQFFDLAAAEKGRIPQDIRSDEDLLKKVPILFRAARGQEVSKADVEALLEKLKEA